MSNKTEVIAQFGRRNSIRQQAAELLYEDMSAGLREVATVAATGTTAANAATLSYGLNIVTGADATKGVILPVAVPGTQVTIKNNTAAVLKVWPQTDSTVNAIGSNAHIAMASLTSATFHASSATQWFTVPLLPS